MYMLRAWKTSILTKCGFREDWRGLTMFPVALKTLSDGVLVAQMHMYLQATLESRGNLRWLFVPPGEWVCAGVHGVLLEVACEFGISWSFLGYGCGGGFPGIQQVSEFCFLLLVAPLLAPRTLFITADALAPLPAYSPSNILSIGAYFVSSVSSS